MRLEVDGLAFGYPGALVGRDVSFGLQGGEVLCLLGPNGSGKTTLFKTVLRLLEPRAGTVTVDGESIARWSLRRLARSFGYVPQAGALFPFTLREVVLMGRTAHVGLFATPSRRDREIAEESLAALEIGHLAERLYTEVSGGERQLALVARALAQEPRVLVMDEPTASLDFGNQVRVLAEIQALARRGIAVVLSTHDPDHAFLCGHRVALLHGGRLARLGTPAEVVTPACLREIYGVEVDVLVLPDDQGGRRVCVPRLARSAGVSSGAEGAGGADGGAPGRPAWD
ncbi:MAG TPA: ABC transporter ATP-binding protein [Methylomirabilota bacterium]|jgi:iron complex transport system ATP-binding protein